MLIGPDFPASIRSGRGRIVYIEFPDCYPYEIAVKLLRDVRCVCGRAILECGGVYYVDLSSNFFCSTDCLPRAEREQLLFQRRALFYRQPSLSLDGDDAAEEEAD